MPEVLCILHVSLIRSQTSGAFRYLGEDQIIFANSLNLPPSVHLHLLILCLAACRTALVLGDK